MSSILVLGRDELKLVTYDPSITVEQFRNQYFSSLEEHGNEGDPAQPRGHFTWNDVPLKLELLMGNYPFGDEDILVFCEQPSYRLDIQITENGKVRFYKVYFDDATTVDDVKKDLIGKARLNDLPPERLLLFTKEGIELSVGDLCLREYGLSHMSFLRAKIMPEIVRCSLAHDLMTARFNKQPLTSYKNGVPVQDVQVVITVRLRNRVDEEWKLISMTCCEDHVTAGPIAIETSAPKLYSTEFVIMATLGALRFDTSYHLVIRSDSVKYTPGNGTVTLSFRTRKERGKIHVTWANAALKWSESPLPDQIPIVHSLYHLLMKKAMSLGPLTSYEPLLRRVRGFRVTYETADEAITVIFDLKRERHEELQFSHYVDGYDIEVEVIEDPLEPVVEPVVAVAAPMLEVGDEGFRTPSRRSPSPIAFERPDDSAVNSNSAAAAPLITDGEREVTEVAVVVDADSVPQTHPPESHGSDGGVLGGEIVVEPGPVELETPAEQSIEQHVEEDVTNEAIPAEDITVVTAVGKALALLDGDIDPNSDAAIDTGHEKAGKEVLLDGEELITIPLELATATTTEVEKVLTEDPAAVPAVTVTDTDPNLVNDGTAAVVDDDDDGGDNDDEVRSVHGEDGVSPARQTSDGTESMVEFMDDGFLVLMTVDPMDESVFVAEDQ